MRSPALSILLLLTCTAAVAAPPDSAAGRVAALRVEVGGLAADVDAERRRAAEQRATWSADQQALEMAVAKARARVAALQKALKGRPEGEPTDADPDYGLLPDIVAGLRERIASGLPYQRAPRLAALDALAEDLERKRADPGRAAISLARFLRDERHLAETVSRAREVLTVDGEARMVDVLRLGLVSLLVQLPDGRAGCTVPAQGYEVRLFKARPIRDAVTSAFGSYHVHPGGGRTLVPAECLAPARSGSTP